MENLLGYKLAGSLNFAPASSTETIVRAREARRRGEKKRPARCAGERGGVLLLPG